jgi:hypothetical protein
LRLPRGFAPVFVATEGGGGTTLAGREVPDDPLLLPEFTLGGGGTTSLAPKILPTKLLSSDPLPDCVGGGGTTVFDGSGTLPLAKWRMSCEMSVEGGGATTAGAGMFSFDTRVLVRSGAETGGGTTATFDICTGALVISRLTAPGAGGMTLAASEGAERVLSELTAGAGATTEGFSVGPAEARSRETRGAGAITVGASEGAMRV